MDRPTPQQSIAAFIANQVGYTADGMDVQAEELIAWIAGDGYVVAHPDDHPWQSSPVEVWGWTADEAWDEGQKAMHRAVFGGDQ